MSNLSNDHVHPESNMQVKRKLSMFFFLLIEVSEKRKWRIEVFSETLLFKETFVFQIIKTLFITNSIIFILY